MSGKIDWSSLSTAATKAAAAKAELQSTFEAQVQTHLDDAAKASGYDNIMTAVSYAEEPAVTKFQSDGLAFRAWRSKVWAYVYQALTEVNAGTRETPTVEAFIAELPPLEAAAT
ncbi:hypothetical protein [Pseudomonas baltica]|uniref:hypothetical protein n=1 Tax=Pseudomonas baltica TaxID=2762576 RepID=UPI0028A1B73C|nr:hypothetical protein [Pseudomonas baltica]